MLRLASLRLHERATMACQITVDLPSYLRRTRRRMIFEQSLRSTQHSARQREIHLGAVLAACDGFVLASLRFTCRSTEPGHLRCGYDHAFCLSRKWRGRFPNERKLTSDVSYTVHGWFLVTLTWRRSQFPGNVSEFRCWSSSKEKTKPRLPRGPTFERLCLQPPSLSHTVKDYNRSVQIPCVPW